MAGGGVAVALDNLHGAAREEHARVERLVVLPSHQPRQRRSAVVWALLLPEVVDGDVVTLRGRAHLAEPQDGVFPVHGRASERDEAAVEAARARRHAVAREAEVPFPHHVRRVARSAQHLGQEGVAHVDALRALLRRVGQPARVTPRVAAAQQRGARRRALRPRVERREAQAAACQRVDGRRLEPARCVVVVADAAVAEVVREQYDDVWRHNLRARSQQHVAVGRGSSLQPFEGE